MNERIKELWDNAATASAAYPSGQNNSWETQVNFMEKFAELIVKECIEVVAMRLYLGTEEICRQECKAIAAEIKHHFGVEE